MLGSKFDGGSPKDMSLSQSLEPVNVTLFGKGVLADTMELRILR